MKTVIILDDRGVWQKVMADGIGSAVEFKTARDEHSCVNLVERLKEAGTETDLLVICDYALDNAGPRDVYRLIGLVGRAKMLILANGNSAYTEGLRKWWNVPNTARYENYAFLQRVGEMLGLQAT